LAALSHRLPAKVKRFHGLPVQYLIILELDHPPCGMTKTCCDGVPGHPLCLLQKLVQHQALTLSVRP
jgi:hypothetical protein